MASVLVVDDSAFMRKMIKTILTKNGLNIAGEAQNGGEGLEMYKKLKPDIVTMDITMPDVNGLDALKSIREIDSKAKIIMVSAMGQEAMVMEALSYGAVSFIVKPFEESRVMEEVNKALKC